MYLSKSDFKVARTCATKLYYKKLGYPSAKDDDPYLQFLADGGYMVETIARLCYPDAVEVGFEAGPEASAEQTMALIKSRDSITLIEATLIYGRRLARVDILRKEGNKFELIEVKSKSVDTAKTANAFRGVHGHIVTAWQEYLEDVAFQYAVLTRLLPEAEVVPYLCLVDKSKTTTIDSIFSKFELNEASLSNARFHRPKVSYTGDAEELRRNNFLAKIDVSSEVHELLGGVENSSATFIASLTDPITKIVVPINVGCRSCEYPLYAEASTRGDRSTRNGFAECWGNLAKEDPSVLDYYYVSLIGGRNSPVVNALLANGRAKFSDLEEKDLVRADGEVGARNIRQRLQRNYTLANQEYIDLTLKRLLENLSYPLHFIDFETSRVAVPYHAGMQPYEQVAFQWSCHTIASAGSELTHTEWINIKDAYPNFKFARSLKQALGDDGTILIWSLFERTALRDIRRQLIKYHEQDRELADWLDRITSAGGPLVDMLQLAKEYYFHPKMKGRLSLKCVLPAVWESDEALHRHRAFSKYYQRSAAGAVLDPYDTLPALPFGNLDEEQTEEVVTEGAGAMRAYQEMLYGVSRHNEVLKEQWRRLLRDENFAAIRIFDFASAGETANVDIARVGRIRTNHTSRFVWYQNSGWKISPLRGSHTRLASSCHGARRFRWLRIF